MLKRVKQLGLKFKNLFGQPLPDVIRKVQADSLTYLSANALEDLFNSVTACEQLGLNGILIEAGCALGGSAIVMAAAKSRARPFFVYDTFSMIPPPSEKDGGDAHKRYRIIQDGQSDGIGQCGYYGYKENLFEQVVTNLQNYDLMPEENNIHLVRGLFEDVLNIGQPVVLAHIDADWYGSVMTCLQRICPHLVSGGVLVVDDYDAWSGCRLAVDEYFSGCQAQYKFIHKSRLHIVRE